MKFSYTRTQHLVRGVFSGSAVASCVLASKAIDPIWGAVLAGAPVVTISTFFIAYRSRGSEFVRALTLPYHVSGVLSICVYSTVVAWTYPRFGVGIGTFLAMLSVIPSSLIVAQLVAFALKRGRNLQHGKTTRPARGI